MEDRFKQRLLKILDLSPPLKGILLSKRDLEEKRTKMREVLDEMLIASLDEDVASLNSIFVRDTIQVFRKILSPRSEQLAGFRPLEYMNDILHSTSANDLPKPSPGFFSELERLMRGITGKAQVYAEKKPAFSGYEGRKAARLRSTELSRMARGAEAYMNRYHSGLEDDVKRRRYRNKARVLSFFNATDFEWTHVEMADPKHHPGCKHLKALVNVSAEEYEAVKLARVLRSRLGSRPIYYSSPDG